MIYNNKTNKMKNLNNRELGIVLRGLSNLKTYNESSSFKPSHDEVFNLMSKLNKSQSIKIN